MSRILPYMLLPPLLVLAGCTTLTDGIYLVRKLDDPVKSRALTEQGIQEYDLALVRRQEYDRLAEVKKYFTLALRYDPLNLQARQYLDRVEDFRQNGVREKLREANTYLSRPARTEEDEYRLQVALQTAARLDPSNEEAERLLRETAQTRSKLVNAYLERGRDLASRADPGSSAGKGAAAPPAGLPPEAREPLIVDAWRSARRAAEVDPRRGDARELRDSLLLDLSRLVDRRVELIDERVEAGRFEEARKSLSSLNELNRTLGGAFDKEARAAGYRLNYRWAADLFERQEYRQAEARVDEALACGRTVEAAELKRKIDEQYAPARPVAAARTVSTSGGRAPAVRTSQQARSAAAAPAASAQSAAGPSAGAGPSFEEGLQEVDRLIASGDLPGARRRIDVLSRSEPDAAQAAALEPRRARLRAMVKDLYEQGVAAYRGERFQEAIGLLQTVVRVDASYELAADYLEKAKAKQQLIEQY